MQLVSMETPEETANLQAFVDQTSIVLEIKMWIKTIVFQNSINGNESKKKNTQKMIIIHRSSNLGCQKQDLRQLMLFDLSVN